MTREELSVAIETATQPLRAMILLAINCGFGQTDCATLPVTAIDLGAGWIDFPRPKTEVDRRCPLWPETIGVLREALPMRPKPKAHADAGLAFLTRTGRPFVRMQESEAGWTSIDNIAAAFTKLLNANGIKRPGINFYAIRHSFRTVADGAKDQPAANAIMGHDPGDMASLYRERIDDERLVAVTETTESLGSATGPILCGGTPIAPTSFDSSKTYFLGPFPIDDGAGSDAYKLLVYCGGGMRYAVLDSGNCIVDQGAFAAWSCETLSGTITTGIEADSCCPGDVLTVAIG